jgi:hypothetical protein
MSRRSLGTLTIDVIAEIGGFASGLDKSERQTEKWRKNVEKQAKMAGVALGTAIAAGVAGLAAGIAKVITNSAAAEQEVAQLDAIIKSTGGAAGYTRQQLLDMADTLASKSTFSGGEIVEAQTRLLSYSGVLGTNIPRAMQAIIDQSARLGISVSQSAETIGRALESPGKAAAALAQSGFGAAFTKEVRGTIDELVKAGKEGEAQVMILEILEESYGGAAQAARDTFGGALKALRHALDDLTTSKDGSLGSATTAVNELTTALNDPRTKDGFDKLISYAVDTTGNFLRLTGSLVEFIAKTRDLSRIDAGGALKDASEGALNQQIATLTERLKLEQKTTSGFLGLPLTGAQEEERLKRINGLTQQRLDIQRELTSRYLAENFKGVTATVDTTAGTPEAAAEAARKAAKAAAADAETATKRLAGQQKLQQSFETTALQYKRQIALFDTSADKSAKATELQQLNFDLAYGSLRGLNAERQESLRAGAAELDQLNAIRDANEKAAKATDEFAKLRKELNREDSLGVDLARERLKVIQAAAAAGAANDSDYAATARRALDQVGGTGADGFAGPDALYGGAAGEFSKIDKAMEQENERYEAQLEALNDYRQARADLESEWDAQEEQMRAEHQKRLQSLEDSRWQVTLTAAQQGLGSVTDIMRNSFGEQSALYKVAFVAQKAAAIAQATLAIQAGMAEAAKNPWPANLAAIASVAAATAGIISSISAVGMAHDGIDSVPETGTWLLQKGERVTTAATSAKLDATLERVNRDSNGGFSGPPITQEIQINGNPDNRTLELVRKAALDGAQMGYDRVKSDMARGTGISRTMRGTHNVGMKVR